MMEPVHLSAFRFTALLALPLLLVAGALPIAAAELPDAPAAQIMEPDTPANATCTITGTVTDKDGDSISAAHVSLKANGQPAMEMITADDGSFTFTGIPAGAFKLSVTAAGFSPGEQTSVLQPGETRELPDIVLAAATTANVQVTADQTQLAQIQIDDEEKQRVLAVIPNFYVAYASNAVPLDPKQKWELAYRTLFDPVTFLFNGIAAGAEQATNTYAWGQGAQGFAKRYAAGYGNILTSTLLGNAALPILLKQDPRYFYKGTGSVRSRMGYAIAMAVMCKGDNMRWQVNYSAILGGVASSAISNAYYPAANRDGAALTFEGAAIGTGVSALSNLVQEFLVPSLTPHLHHKAQSNP